MRAALAAALHHSRDVGPGTNDVPRGQTTARETEEPELFTLYEEELGGTRPDRLSDVRPQERVQRRTVEQLVVAVLDLPALDALVPLVVEQLADILPACRSEGKGGGCEDGPAGGHDVLRPVSKRRGSLAQMGPGWLERKKKKKLPMTSLRHAARVPAVLLRVHGGASVPVHRQCAGHFSCMQRQVRTVHTVQAIGDSTGS